MYAVAHALHDLIEVQNRTSIVGSDIHKSLLELSFEGVTGTVSHSANGNRLTGASYALVNYASNELGLVHVGAWAPCVTADPSDPGPSSQGPSSQDPIRQSCEASHRLSALNRALTFSTADNSRPASIHCPPDSELQPNGQCLCSPGFEYSLMSRSCLGCGAGMSKAGFGNTKFCAYCKFPKWSLERSSGCNMCRSGYIDNRRSEEPGDGG